MRDDFDGDLKRVLVLEGGYVNNPKDPGGETNYGVTRVVYDAYRKNKGLPIRSVRAIAMDEVTDIYRVQYANKVRYDDLSAGVDGVVFDGAINSGPARSVMWLQRALGTVKVDGLIGEATIAAVNDYPDHDLLIARICEQRLAFLKALDTWSTFGRGWANRIAQVKTAGQAVASGSVGRHYTYVAGGEAKAIPGPREDVRTAR